MSELNQAEPQLTFAGFLTMLLSQCGTWERARAKRAFGRGGELISRAANQKHKQTNKNLIPFDNLGMFVTILPIFQLGHLNVFATFEDLE